MRCGTAGRTRRAIAAAALALCVAPHALGAEFLRRARPLEEIVGRVEIRRGRMARVPVPIDCRGNRRGCMDERMFDEAARLDFVVERRTLDDGTLRETETPAGTLLIAASFTDRGRIEFWDGVEAAARRLAAEAFVLPFAGWSPGQPPFDGDSVVRSTDEWWGCFASERDDVLVQFTAPVRRGDTPAGGSAFGSRVYGSAPPATCGAIRAATGSAPPESRRTAPSPLRSREEVVELFEQGDLPRGAPIARVLPAGARLRREPAPAGMTAASLSRDEAREGRVATRIAGGWRYEAIAEPAEIPWRDLGRDAWLGAWSVRTVERRFGLAPRDEVLGSTRLLTAVLATVPPEVDATGGAAAMPPALDRAALLERLGTAIDRGSGPPAWLVEEFLLGGAADQIPAGWLAVVCRPDGSATYALPPTTARGTVTNASTFCRALDEALRLQN